MNRQHYALSLMAVAAVLAAGSNLLLRHTMRGIAAGASDGSVLVQAFHSWKTFVGLGGYGVSQLLYLHLLSRVQLAVAFPVYMSSLILLVMVGSTLFLHESLTVPRLLSGALIMAGILVAEGRREP